jgi:hypothetical protein
MPIGRLVNVVRPLARAVSDPVVEETGVWIGAC